jgi:hypothetical protein
MPPSKNSGAFLSETRVKKNKAIARTQQGADRKTVGFPKSVTQSAIQKVSAKSVCKKCSSD